MAVVSRSWVYVGLKGVVVSKYIDFLIPYSGYFSRGINFRGFRGQLASAKN